VVNIPSSITTLLIGIALAGISLWYGQNHGLMPIAASSEAVLIDGLFNTMMIISTGLFLIVQGALVYSAFKFRRQPGDDSDGPYIEGNIPLEILWTSIPAVIVFGIAIYSFEVYTSIGEMNPGGHVAHKQHPTEHVVASVPGAAYAASLPKGAIAQAEGTPANSTQTNVVKSAVPTVAGTEPDMEIEATGLQYAWIFTYPDSGVVAGELHVPVGKRIHLNISANDVLHAFWVPEYRLKQDAIPGTPTDLSFTPSQIGEYPVICAELCGPYHGAMKTKVIAETQADFDAWIQSQLASADGFDEAIALATQTSANKSTNDFLTPFVNDLGINAETLHQLHSQAPHSALID
jgi:cytochrome c oxidase subunit II